MAVDMFLKIKDVTGEAQDKKYAEWIDVLAWSWGMSQSGTMHVGTGGGGGKVAVQDLSITKYVDKSTPNIMLFCSNGKNIGETTLIVRKAGENPVDYIKMTMTDCIITSVSTGGSGGEDRLTENVSINFAKVQVDYTPQKENGTADTPIPYKWHVAKNATF